MKGQEDTHESWQKTVSGWTLESISFSQRIVKRWNSLSEEAISAGSVNTFKKKVGRSKKDEEGLTHGLMSAGTKADSEGTLVRPNQVNDQVNME